MDLGFNRLSTYGLIKDQTQKEVSFFIDYLISEGIIDVEGGSFPILKVSAKGKEVLTGERTVQEKSKQKVLLSISLRRMDYFRALRTLRKTIAEQKGFHPLLFFQINLYTICV